MVEADLRGWLPIMGVALAEEQIARILDEAEHILGPGGVHVPNHCSRQCALLFPDEGNGWRKTANRIRSTVALVHWFDTHLNGKRMLVR